MVPNASLEYLDLRQRFDKEGISAYALTRIYSPAIQDVILSLRADDGARLWLNGRLVHSDKEGRIRTLLDAHDAIAVTLRPGWNTVLAKVVNAPDTDQYALSLEFIHRSPPGKVAGESN